MKNGMNALLWSCCALLIACEDSSKLRDNGRCGSLDNAEGVSTIYDIQGYQLDIYRKLPDRPEYVSTEVVRFDQIVFVLTAQTQIIAANDKGQGSQPSIDRQPQRRLVSIFPSAYACSLAPTLPIAAERLVGLAITATSDYTDALPVDSSLNAIFDITDMQGGTTYWEFDGVQRDFYSVERYLQQGLNAAASYTALELTEAPASADMYTFEVQISLDSGEIYTLQTDAINLSN
ncbi:Uncharacterised protein [BD1-7 clade bacterium]|uniref:Uncharacterized protein n=1 Tax=BD1-7 clade bacterium TaxID=2029982 RepID=A0A5S9PQB9_9GAMM|nr:Uncharacterised protein [BD1-7 clade bacterium]